MSLSFHLVLLVSSMAVAAESAPNGLIWIEAEQFQACGGWTNDAQFIDQMGSPYLLAIGLGQPVRDAVTVVTLPAPGRYRLWVRAKDWGPEHHPGTFRVLVNDRAADRVFGGSGQRGWVWEDGGEFDLAERAEVRLHDLTGFYGRCDALVFSRDLSWTPPQDAAALAALREQCGGVSREVQDAGPFDVVVVGGGLAGCTAAVAATRLGAKTALVQNRPVLGGNASTEILVPPVGVWPHAKNDPLDPRETGLVEEYRTAGNQTAAEAVVYSSRLLRFVQAEPNLTLFLNTHANGVEMRKGAAPAIAAVRAVDTLSGRRLRLSGRYFIDCTGDGVIGVAAGNEFRQGKEPRSLHQEPWAPEVASSNTMGNTLKYVGVDAQTPEAFAAPPWATEFPTCDSFAPGRHPRLQTDTGGQWKIELGGLSDTYANAEEIRDDLLRLIFGMWDHLKNHCPRCEREARTYRLAWVGHVAGKRETRRLLGDYILTENDIRQQVRFPDRVAYGGWVLDDHHSAGFFHQGSFGVHYDRPGGLDPCQGLPFSIPYRSLYAKDVENLLLAGRDISVTHMALSDTRVMLTCAVIGQAAGTAAALCVEHSTTPRGVYQSETHRDQLQQQLLKDGAYVIGLPNRDPRDLARAATVTASSELKRADGELLAAANVIDGFARMEDGKPHAWSPQLDGPQPHWLELVWQTPQRFNVVHVTFATKLLTPDAFRIEAWQETEWRVLAEQTGITQRRYVLGLPPTTAAKIRCAFTGMTSVCEVRVYDEPESVLEVARRVAANRDLPDTGPGLPWLYDVDPQTLPGLVIDAAEAQVTGRWTVSTYSRPFVLDGYLHDGDEGKGEKSIRFVPVIPRAGRYEVRLAYVPFGNRATNTPVTVATPTASTTLRVNQRTAPEHAGLFHTLGTFDLPAGEQTTITVTNAETDGYVVVDAIQLLPR